MTKEALKLISDGMASLDLNYAFMRWNGDAADTYFVGEYQEIPGTTEDGAIETDFTLTGITRGSWLNLETAKETIEGYFNRISGQRAIADNGTAVAVFYSNSNAIPSADADLKRIEINLTVKEWKVN